MNLKKIYENLSFTELKQKKIDIETRIKHLENDLRRPFDQDAAESSVVESSRVVLSSLLQTEKEMLGQLNQVLEMRTHETI